MAFVFKDIWKTIELDVPGGISDYCKRYGASWPAQFGKSENLRR